MDNHDQNHVPDLGFVVGEEKRLRDILARGDVMPLLDAGVQTGMRSVSITDAGGNMLWSCGAGTGSGAELESFALSLEGEVVGYINFERASLKTGAARIIQTAVQTILTANLKRMLTAEVHTSVVNISYDDLVESNRLLTLSEQRYRELAANLEQKVRERTAELEQAHARLMQQEKMASIGQLAAGMAHEINNPLGFISSNLSTLKTYMARCADFMRYVASIQEGEDLPPAVRESLAQRSKELKLDLILQDVPALVEESLSGAGRITALVSDLRGFSHIDDSGAMPVDLNAELDMLLNILSHEISGRVRVVKQYSPLRPLACKPGLLVQAFLNIIKNSLAARGEGLELIIATRQLPEGVCVQIKDNGPGIPEEIIHRVFDPFFTTREVGQGMGLGLTIAYDIITAHKGTIEIQGHPGTSVTVRLPGGA